MKHALKLKGTVSRTGRIKIEDKTDLPPGEVDVFVFSREDAEESKPVGMTSDEILENLRGLWAHRDDITDGASYSLELRRKIETRQDRD